MPRHFHSRGRRTISALSSRSDAAMARSSLSRNPNMAGSVVTRVMTQGGGLSSTIGGNIANIINLAPSGFSAWGAFSVEYDEWRLIGAEIKFYCQQQNSLTVQSQPIIVVYDNDDAGTALSTATGIIAGLDYRLNRQFASIWDNQNFPTLRAYTYSSADPSSGRAWATTATPTANPCSFKLISTGLTASTSYLTYTVRASFQFRGAI